MAPRLIGYQKKQSNRGTLGNFLVAARDVEGSLTPAEKARISYDGYVTIKNDQAAPSYQLADQELVASRYLDSRFRDALARRPFDAWKTVGINNAEIDDLRDGDIIYYADDPSVHHQRVQVNFFKLFKGVPFMRLGARIRIIKTSQARTQLVILWMRQITQSSRFPDDCVIQAAVAVRQFYVLGGDAAEFMWDGAQIV
ncbi:hypothetical protein [Pseudomonas fluorescens]|uniref:hypothetical protein n=1 Tax=Pseudomonas fluorescens TaxID=294 RepID=UPI001240BFC3|nr:hypothetical protein [Pseudomonas fluorescens]